MNKKLVVSVIAIVLCLQSLTMLVSLTNAVDVHPNPQLSVVLSGTQGTNFIYAQPVGSTFSVDVRIDNTSGIPEGINAFEYTLTWNSSILLCSNVFNARANPQSFLNLGDSGHVIETDRLNNAQGKLTVTAAISDTSNASASAKGSGVCTTLTFVVLSKGATQISLQPWDSGYAYLYYPKLIGTINNQPITNTITSNATFGYDVIDYNLDGKVNFLDIIYLVHAYIDFNNGGALTASCDLNHDGRINFIDLQLFVSDYVASAQN